MFSYIFDEFLVFIVNFFPLYWIIGIQSFVVQSLYYISLQMQCKLRHEIIGTSLMTETKNFLTFINIFLIFNLRSPWVNSNPVHNFHESTSSYALLLHNSCTRWELRCTRYFVPKKVQRISEYAEDIFPFL